MSERQQKKMLISNIAKKTKNNELTKIKRNIKGETCLHKACIKGNLLMVEKILQTGIEINVKDNAGWTPLHEACNRGFLDVVRYLLENGANVNAPGGPNNDTPLHDASMNKHMDVVKLLLEHGADIEFKNSLNISSKQLLQDDSECCELFPDNDEFTNPNLAATPKSENDQFLDQSSLLLTPQDTVVYGNKDHTTNDKLHDYQPSLTLNEIKADASHEKSCYNTIECEKEINKENFDNNNINTLVIENVLTKDIIKEPSTYPFVNTNLSHSWLSNPSYELICQDRFYCSYLCILRAIDLSQCKCLDPTSLTNLHFAYCMVPTSESIIEIKNWINNRDEAVKFIRKLMGGSRDYYSPIEMNRLLYKHN